MSHLTVIINCTKSKRHDTGAVPCRVLYRGRGFRRALSSVDDLRRTQPHLPVRVHTVSAKYGLVAEQDWIEPYDTGLPMRLAARRQRGRQLSLRTDIEREVITSRLTVIQLSAAYLDAAGVRDLPFPERVLAVTTRPDLLPVGVAVVRAGAEEARRRQVSLRDVGSVLLSQVLSRIADSPELLGSPKHLARLVVR